MNPLCDVTTSIARVRSWGGGANKKVVVLSRWARLALEAQKEGEAAQRRQTEKKHQKIKAEQHDEEEFKQVEDG